MSYYIHAFASSLSTTILYDTKSVLPIRCYPLRFAFENKNAILETHDEQSMKWLT